MHSVGLVRTQAAGSWGWVGKAARPEGEEETWSRSSSGEAAGDLALPSGMPGQEAPEARRPPSGQPCPERSLQRVMDRACPELAQAASRRSL